MNVLIVDDELSIRETFQAFLEDEGYDATTAADFFEAESFLAEHSYDVVVADIILPRINGLMLLQRVREIDADVPVIMVTGEPDVSTAAEAVRHGAYDYIAKPVTQEMLLRVVGRAAERKRLLDDKRRLEADNRAYQVDLERKVAERTAELEQRNQELAALIEIGHDISATLDLTEVLKRVAQRAAQVCGAHRCTILLLAEDGEMLSASMSQFSNGHVDEEQWRLFKDASYPVSVSQAPEVQRIIREQRPLFVSDAPASSLPNHLLEPFDIKSVLLVPLISKERTIGLMALDHVEERREFTVEQVDLAMAVATQAAVATENARLYDDAQREIAERKRAEEELRERAVRLELVARMGQRTTAILELDELLHQAVDLIGDAFGYYNVNVLLVENGEIVLRAATLPLARSREGRLRLRIDSESITGWVAGSGEPLLAPDVSLDARYYTAVEETKTKSELAVPIKLKKMVIGVLDAQSTERDGFSEADVFTLQTIADQLAIAIENAQLYEEARRHVEELTALHNIDVAITSTLNLDEVLQQVYEQVSAVIDVAAFHIALYDEEKGELYLPIIVDQGKQLPPLTLKVGEENGLSGWIIRTREPLWIGDMEKEQDALPVKAITLGVPTRSLMVLPLVVRDKVVGVISAQSYEPYAFDEGHRRLFTGIASQVAIAVENARLFEETHRRLNEISLLHDVALAAAATLDFDEILRHTVESVRDRLQLDVFGFLLVDEEAGVARLHPTFLGVPDEIADFSIPLGEGITGWVAQTGQPLLVPDVSQEPRYLDAVPGICSELCVPLKSGGKVIGVIDAESIQLDAFSEDDVRLFSTLASQLGVVLENARLFEETKRHLAETRLLQEVMQAAASTLDFDEVLTRTIETLHRTLGISHLTFVLPDEREDSLRVHPSWIGYPSLDVETRIPMDSSISGQVYQTGEPQNIPDVRQAPYYFETAPEIRSELVVPVKVADKVVAVLDAESPHLGAFGEDDLRLFSAVAAQLGVVLDNARLFEETNRRLTETRLLQEVMQAAASTLDFDEVVTRIIETLHRTLDIDYLTFVLPDEQGNMMIHPSRIGYPPLLDDPFIPLDQSVCGQVYQSGEPQVISDVREVPYYSEGMPETLSELAVPVKVAGRVIAVLNAESPQLGAFGEEELRIFSAIAAQMGVVLENARLYQRLEAQAIELSRAYEDLREIDRLRTELVQNVSHELRTPLSLVRGYVELLLDGDLGPIHDDQRDALRIIRERAAALSRLIHNLTMLQDVPRELLSLAPVSVAEVIRHALDEFRRPAKQASISFRKDLPAELPLLLGDRGRLELVFDHLVGNAVKFSPGGGTVSIRAWAEQEMVYVSVADEGIGIASEHLERIFERFYQVNGSTRRRFGGMGIGLALVWEIIRDHGGAVTVESEPGEGSTFTIALPVVSSQ